MLKKILEQRGISLTKDLSDAVTDDIKFNNIGFGKRTNLERFLLIAEISEVVIKKSA
jgi:hypothetical protein